MRAVFVLLVALAPLCVAWDACDYGSLVLYDLLMAESKGCVAAGGCATCLGTDNDASAINYTYHYIDSTHQWGANCTFGNSTVEITMPVEFLRAMCCKDAGHCSHRYHQCEIIGCLDGDDDDDGDSDYDDNDTDTDGGGGAASNVTAAGTDCPSWGSAPGFIALIVTLLFAVAISAGASIEYVKRHYVRRGRVDGDDSATAYDPPIASST